MNQNERSRYEERETEEPRSNSCLEGCDVRSNSKYARAFRNARIYKRGVCVVAKIVLWTTHNSQRVFVWKGYGSISIQNDGTIDIRIPREIADKIGFDEQKVHKEVQK